MATLNPYQPPTAVVDDVEQAEGFQQPRLFTWRGRIGRLRYLAWVMYGYFLAILASAVLGAIAGFTGLAARSEFIGVITAVALIPYFIFAVFAAIQRSHDMDWSGWTVFLMIIPFVAFIWVFKAGESSGNRFGLPPPPNPTSVKIGAFLMPVIAGIGILAAIMVPIYQSYEVKAKASQVRP